ncbi:SHI-related sequence 7 [Striga asiatica]|uniref:SHI-related sequence 7 n=1 Tax=Striga asiatica TaxID=4170 RepID=A0A5A7Q4H4_STRAF|nr:SHI-related sequence 7 [Striga asiatica]
MEGLDGGGRWWLSTRGGGSRWLTATGGRTASRSRWLSCSPVSGGARRSPPCYRTDRLCRRRAAAVGRRTVTSWFLRKREREREREREVQWNGDGGDTPAAVVRHSSGGGIFFPAAGKICLYVMVSVDKRRDRTLINPKHPHFPDLSRNNLSFGTTRSTDIFGNGRTAAKAFKSNRFQAKS